MIQKVFNCYFFYLSSDADQTDLTAWLKGLFPHLNILIIYFPVFLHVSQHFYILLMLEVD